MEEEKIDNLKRCIGYNLSNSEKCELALWIMGDVQDSLGFKEEALSSISNIEEIPVIPF